MTVIFLNILVVLGNVRATVAVEKIKSVMTPSSVIPNQAVTWAGVEKRAIKSRLELGAKRCLIHAIFMVYVVQTVHAGQCREIDSFVVAIKVGMARIAL